MRSPSPAGKERRQEPVRIAPLPTYEHPTFMPKVERAKRSDTPLLAHPDRDPEREYVPVSTSPPSPTRIGTKPFFPAWRAPEHVPMSIVDDMQPEQSPPSSLVSVPGSHAKPELELTSPDTRHEEDQPVHGHPTPTNSHQPEQTIRTIRHPGTDNSDNSHEPTSSQPNTSRPTSHATVPLEPFERIGRVGRQRRYEVRKNFVNSVRDVVLWRHVEGRAYPNISRDMKRWYEFFYFTTPMKGEKPFNANTTYEQHIEAYERGRAWIKRYRQSTATRPLGYRTPADL